MVKHKPNGWKGCCPMCSGLRRGVGWQERLREGELRRGFEGRKRRVRRNDVPRKEEW